MSLKYIELPQKILDPANVSIRDIFQEFTMQAASLVLRWDTFWEVDFSPYTLTSTRGIVSCSCLIYV